MPKHSVFCLWICNLILMLYTFSTDGGWDLENGEVLAISNASAPVNKMLAVAGKLWCACGPEIQVISPATLEVEVSSCSGNLPTRDWHHVHQACCFLYIAFIANAKMDCNRLTTGLWQLELQTFRPFLNPPSTAHWSKCQWLWKTKACWYSDLNLFLCPLLKPNNFPINWPDFFASCMQMTWYISGCIHRGPRDPEVDSVRCVCWSGRLVGRAGKFQGAALPCHVIWTADGSEHRSGCGSETTEWVQGPLGLSGHHRGSFSCFPEFHLVLCSGS